MKKNEQFNVEIEKTAMSASASGAVTRRSLAACVVSGALALALLAGCGGAPAATDAGSTAGSASEKGADTSAVATGKLIVGFDQSYPPYGYVGDDGEYTGFDLDLAAAVAEKEGWELQLEAIDWDAKDALLCKLAKVMAHHFLDSDLVDAIPVGSANLPNDYRSRS